MTTPWWDIEMRGRRLESLSKHMTTKYHKLQDKEPLLALSYIDRIAKIETVIKPYVEEITGLKKLIKDNDEISNRPPSAKVLRPW